MKLKVFNAYIFCSKDLLSDYIYFARENKLNWDLLIMSKRNPIPTKNNKYLSDKEYCIFIRETGAFFNNELDYEKYFSVKKVSVTKNKFHSAEKPLSFIEDLILMSSNENDLVLDPFIGSGTTAIACVKHNRNFIGFEKKEKYFDIANKRLAQFDRKYLDELDEEDKPKQQYLF